MSNLRQMGQAMQMYVNASKGSLPFGEYVPNYNGALSTRWFAVLQNTLNSRYGITFNDAQQSGSHGAKLRELFICPDAPGNSSSRRPRPSSRSTRSGSSPPGYTRSRR